MRIYTKVTDSRITDNNDPDKPVDFVSQSADRLTETEADMLNPAKNGVNASYTQTTFFAQRIRKRHGQRLWMEIIWLCSGRGPASLLYGQR